MQLFLQPFPNYIPVALRRVLPVALVVMQMHALASRACGSAWRWRLPHTSALQRSTQPRARLRAAAGRARACSAATAASDGDGTSTSQEQASGWLLCNRREATAPAVQR